MNDEKRHTEVIPCRHCGNSAPMEVVSAYSEYEYFTDGLSGEEHGELFAVYELCVCPTCSHLTLRQIDHVTPTDEPPITVLYPEAVENKAPRGVPDDVRRAYVCATRVRSIDANAYAVLLGRVLETVCRDRKAMGDTLAKKLLNLSERNEIPGRLADVAKGLRQLRNVGAHADLGELTEAEVPVLDNLTCAILEYVYTAPLLVSDAEECLKRLRGDDDDVGGQDR